MQIIQKDVNQEATEADKWRQSERHTEIQLSPNAHHCLVELDEPWLPMIVHDDHSPNHRPQRKQPGSTLDHR